MIHIRAYGALAAAFFFCGIVLYACQAQWILFRIPAINTEKLIKSSSEITKKNVTLWYWHNDSWHHETVELLWSANQAKNIELLSNTWLSLLGEEGVITKRITVQSVALCQRNSEALISFDRYPFNREGSTFEKVMLIEGLLKTIRINGGVPQAVRFLVHHEQLNDYHLDFSNPWPIIGFTENTNEKK